LALGCHLSTTGGYAEMGRRALGIGASTFAFFTRNPRGGNAKPLDERDVAELRQLMADNGFGKLVAHAPYTMNLCSAKPETIDFARRAMAGDLERMESLPGNYYNFHPGSHVKQGADTGIELICAGLNEVLVPGQATIVLLETMAGKGSEVGRTFEELARILDGVQHDELMGVCLDTCHVWDGGYDVVGALDQVLDEFDRVVGLERLKALHLNDSKNPCGAHKDRHEKIGQGCLGIDCFAAIVNHPQLHDLPMILETPNELDGYAAEIAQLRGLAGEPSEEVSA
jgi:deoxyribonuclease-4